MNNIYILSAPIQTGKTTALMEFWEMGAVACDGFITPDIDDTRKLIFLDTDEEFPLELEDVNDKDAIEIGKFKFSKSTFLLAKKKLKTLHETSAQLIIIDEIGQLELFGFGYEPEISNFIDKFKSECNDKLLILVVRDSLLNQAIEKYKLEDADVLSLKLFIDKFLPE